MRFRPISGTATRLVLARLLRQPTRRHRAGRARAATRARSRRHPLEPRSSTAKPEAKLRVRPGIPGARLATRRPRPVAAALRPVTAARHLSNAAARPAPAGPLPATAARPRATAALLPATAALLPATAALRPVTAARPRGRAAPHRVTLAARPATAAHRVARARSRRETSAPAGVSTMGKRTVRVGVVRDRRCGPRPLLVVEVCPEQPLASDTA